eukprot:scaffold4027_cov245-Pinguiococcus_pyrenoidosus.AAC.5
MSNDCIVEVHAIKTSAADSVVHPELRLHPEHLLVAEPHIRHRICCFSHALRIDQHHEVPVIPANLGEGKLHQRHLHFLCGHSREAAQPGNSRAPACGGQSSSDCLLPVRSVHHPAVVREWSLRPSAEALSTGHGVGDGHQERAQSEALKVRQDQDTVHVVPLRAAAIAGEEASDVRSVLIVHGQYEEMERGHIIQDRLMVQEHLPEAPDPKHGDRLDPLRHFLGVLRFPAADPLRHAVRRIVYPLSVDLLAGRSPLRAVVHMVVAVGPVREHLQAEVTEEERICLGRQSTLGKWGAVPGLQEAAS